MFLTKQICVAESGLQVLAGKVNEGHMKAMKATAAPVAVPI